MKMKSYLSLIPISAKVRRRQNCMTLLCIIFAVFLVTAIFSMAEMFVRMETMHARESHGNWHIRLANITDSEAEIIRSRDEVAAASWYDVVNLDMDRAYLIDGRQTVLCGIEEMLLTDIMSYFPEGCTLQEETQAILTPNAKELLGLNVGDMVTLNTPAASYEFRVTGFRSNDSRYVNSNGGEVTALLVEEGQIGVFMNIAAFRRIVAENHDEGKPSYFVKFADRANMKKAITAIMQQCGLGEGDVEQNTIVMGAAGLSDKEYIREMYPIIMIFFLLILLAGILMISSSMNSNIAQRSQFFGMMRCIGMSRHQVIRFVRLEALNWCKTAIPVGVALGTVISWVLCAVLRYYVAGEFSEMPVFGLSGVGVIGGMLVGLLTVLIAAQAPAKRAAKVSPVAAISGNTSDTKKVYHSTKIRFSKIETKLGVSHAVSAKKNLLLMVGSFALSIILFLCFSVLVELLGYLIPTKLYAPDIDIASSDFSNSIDYKLVEEIRNMNGVKYVYGRRNVSSVPAEFSAEVAQKTVDIISYDDLQLDWLPKDGDLRKGSDLTKVYGDQGCVLTIWDENNPLGIGDKVQLCGTEVEITGMLKFNPFSNSGGTDGKIILICSEDTFLRLTGERNYIIIDVQVTKDATDADVEAIRNLVRGEEFRDRREEANGSLLWAFGLFIYGFVAIIALITLLNIVNSISMSVSARTRQYGAMRAVGMNGRQLTKMIAAEALTYAFAGCVVGCTAGLLLNKLIYDKLITSHFTYYTWSVPVQTLLIILLFVFLAAAAAIYAPAKRMRAMAVTDTINEL